MLPRIWIALLALLLLGACAGATSAELGDLPAPSGLVDDDDTNAHVPAPSVESTRARAVCAARPHDAVPPLPGLARIFRPPRSPLA